MKPGVVQGNTPFFSFLPPHDKEHPLAGYWEVLPGYWWWSFSTPSLWRRFWLGNLLGWKWVNQTKGEA